MVMDVCKPEEAPPFAGLVMAYKQFMHWVAGEWQWLIVVVPGACQTRRRAHSLGAPFHKQVYSPQCGFAWQQDWLQQAKGI